MGLKTSEAQGTLPHLAYPQDEPMKGCPMEVIISCANMVTDGAIGHNRILKVDGAFFTG